jgi:hypothetical protein
MTKVHWIVSYQSKRFFKYVIKATNLNRKSMAIYYDWCEDTFGKSLSASNLYADWNPGFDDYLYFKRKSDMLLFLMTWQDIEI